MIASVYALSLNAALADTGYPVVVDYQGRRIDLRQEVFFQGPQYPPEAGKICDDGGCWAKHYRDYLKCLYGPTRNLDIPAQNPPPLFPPPFKMPTVYQLNVCGLNWQIGFFAECRPITPKDGGDSAGSAAESRGDGLIVPGVSR